MKPFRFTAAHFAEYFGCMTNSETGKLLAAQGIAEIANAILEAEEAECERVELGPDGDGKFSPFAKFSTHTALLWGIEKIEEIKK